MSRVVRLRLALLLGFMVLGCSGDPGSPSTGTITVNITGLPNGSSAAVNVTGPNGYTQAITSSQALTGLQPGVYTIAAANVTIGSTVYSANPTSQTVALSTSSTAASATVNYGTPTGSLSVNISGAGTTNSAQVSVAGPGGFNQLVTNSRTLIDLIPGSYSVTAQNVTASCGNTTYMATPANQTVSVVANVTASADVSYTSPSGGPVNLCIDGMYLTQSAQTYGGTIPLVQNRAGLIRVFVVANQAGTPAAAVQVKLRFFNGATLQDSVTLTPSLGLVSVPTAPDESALSNSWNYSLPGSMVFPGMRIEAEVDPTNAVAESDEADNVLAPAAPTVRSVPTVNVTFVPITQGGRTGDVTDANKTTFIDMARRMHPIDGMNLLVRSTPITTTTVLQADGTGWQTVLDLVDAIAAADGTRYYYGVAKVSYTSGVAGVAYVSTPGFPEHAALGWDFLQNGSASVVAAHELAHNWGRRHAPCGGPSGIDPNYPEPDGSTGNYGYDVSSGKLEPPSSGDIMGYCDPKWISDYTYSGVLDYFTSSPMVAGTDAASQAVQPCLLVWGSIRDGQLELKPAFQINARPRLPGRSGPYTVEARAEDGSTLFAHSFSPSEIADLPGSHQSFAFAIPLAEARAQRLASLRLRGQGQELVVTPSSGAAAQAAAQAADQPALRRLGTGRVALDWNHRAYPMVLVRDADTGEILSIADGGQVQLPGASRQLDLVFSDGVRSFRRQVPVTP
jgi:hypothetical protein